MLFIASVSALGRLRTMTGMRTNHQTGTPTTFPAQAAREQAPATPKPSVISPADGKAFGRVPNRRPMSYCAATGHTAPGSYLPSWLTKKIPNAAPLGSSAPRLRATPHQARNEASNPAPPAAVAATTHPGAAAPNVAQTASPFRRMAT